MMSANLRCFLLFLLLLIVAIADTEAFCKHSKMLNYVLCNGGGNGSKTLRFKREWSNAEALWITDGNFSSLRFRGPESCRKLTWISVTRSDKMERFDLGRVPTELMYLEVVENAALQEVTGFARLQEMSQLYYLRLDNNSLTSFDFLSVPEQLQTLSLLGNALTEVDMRAVLRVMFRQGNHLVALDLRGNEALACGCSAAVGASTARFDERVPGCGYVECFVCNWLKSNKFVTTDLNEDFRIIKSNRRACIPGLN